MIKVKVIVNLIILSYVSNKIIILLQKIINIEMKKFKNSIYWKKIMFKWNQKYLINIMENLYMEIKFFLIIILKKFSLPKVFHAKIKK